MVHHLDAEGDETFIIALILREKADVQVGRCHVHAFRARWIEGPEGPVDVFDRVRVIQPFAEDDQAMFDWGRRIRDFRFGPAGPAGGREERCDKKGFPACFHLSILFVVPVAKLRGKKGV
jgi:hypothetical protein